MPLGESSDLALSTVGHLGELRRARDPLMVAHCTGEGRADYESKRHAASSSSSSSRSEDAPLSFFMIAPTRSPTVSSTTACAGQRLIDDDGSTTGGVLGVEQHPLAELAED
jgi:hypothetical protein